MRQIFSAKPTGAGASNPTTAGLAKLIGTPSS
jgi:hypothetical protein